MNCFFRACTCGEKPGKSEFKNFISRLGQLWNVIVGCGKPWKI